MNVNQKGVIGLIKIIDNLQENGYYTFPAFDDHSPIDLIAVNRAGIAHRLQIKYRSREGRKVSDKYEIRTSSVVNGKRVENNREMIDGWAVYLADHKKIVYIHKSKLEGLKGLTIDPNKDYGGLDEWFKSAPC